MLKIVENLWAVGALSRSPLGELTALPDPIAGGYRGIAAPSPGTLPPLSAFRSSPN